MNAEVFVFGVPMPLPVLVVLAVLEGLNLVACISLLRDARAKYVTLIPGSRSPRQLIQGTVVEESTIIAPLSGRACVAFFVRVFEVPWWYPLRELEACAQRQAVPFELALANGKRLRVILEPDYCAAVDYPSDFVRYVRDLDGLDQAARNRFRALPSYHTIDGWNRPLEFREYRLEARKPVVLAGLVEGEPRDGILRISDARFAPGTLEEVHRVYWRVISFRVALRCLLFALVAPVSFLLLPVLASRVSK